VCIKFKTFVCNDCKSSHQAISHRCKSITMSDWSVAEVESLMDENGGGNLACRHIWLGGAPPPGGRYATGSRPKDGDRIDVFKKFILDAYEHGKFKLSEPYQSTHAGGNTPTSTPSSPRTPASAPAPAHAPIRAGSSASALVCCTHCERALIYQIFTKAPFKICYHFDLDIYTHHRPFRGTLADSPPKTFQ
jgi:hypothetical protein